MECELLIINEDPAVEEVIMNWSGIYFSVSCCLCFIKEITMDSIEEQSRAERDTDI